MKSTSMPHRIGGQAMAEFVVMVAGCVLLMFVAVPVVGKLTDMAFKSQEMARYAAWERTVWYGTAEDHLGQNSRDYSPSQYDRSQISSISPADRSLYAQLDTVEGLPTRSNEDIFNSAEKRLLTYEQKARLFSDDDISAAGNADTNRFWRWTSGESRAMTLPGASAEGSSMSNSAPASLANTLVGGYNSLMNPIAKVVNILSFGQGDEDLLQIAHPRRNLYSSDVRIPVSLAGSTLGNKPLVGDAPLSVNARAAILADAWVAQDELHMREKSDDFVLGTGLEDNPLWDGIKTAVSIMEPSFKHIDLAPVNTAPIPDSDVKCNPRTGFCYLDD
ncbi:hypothetical protein EGJ86_12405 [Pseudomonas sp. o96-267]|uniref:hypothetical protein n=1 Tax=Pseudomonas TaxID=286 RepID=UPI000F7AE8E1|nr:MULTISPECIES: hypothetical protein [Pseudomonas]RRV38254.1 hypothetical protein EGJ86_12405 [Pseudomonas sp. o96-267]UFQ97186.1 hypothetical protein J7655_18155 [Pseudomonas wenzhouensis]